MRLLPKHNPAGWTPYGWLIYLLIFLIQPFSNHSAAEWLEAGAGLVAFLPLYFWSHWLHGRRKLWPIAGMVALGCVYAPLNGGSSVFFIYAASFIADAGDRRTAFRYLGALLAIIAATALVFRMPPGYWFTAIVLSALIGAVMIHFYQQHRLLHRAEEEISHLAQVAERERIARDLHDLLGHTLSVIVLKSELASRLAEREPARAIAEIREVERISREALAQVRAAVKGYRSVGLNSELEKVQRTLETAGIRVESSLERAPLTAEQESVLALALREAATNVIRHAHANSCRIALRNECGRCVLEIADDGRGGASADGGGLTGMRERIEGLGGSFELESRKGTLVRLTLPLPAVEASGAA